MKKLKKIGFFNTGKWNINDSNLVIEYSNNCDKSTNTFLYAFVYNNIVKYIGKSNNPLNVRMKQYVKPGISQSTNLDINSKIKTLLSDKKREHKNQIKIFIFPCNGQLSYKGYRINLAAGLEDSLIREFNPEWNKIGKLKEKVEFKSNLSIINKNNKTKLKNKSIKFFEVTLGKTYYNKGFFNVPVRYTKSIDKRIKKIKLILKNGEEIEARISRTDNLNGTPRIRGNNKLKLYFKNNFKQGDKLDVIIDSPIMLSLK